MIIASIVLKQTVNTGYGHEIDFSTTSKAHIIVRFTCTALLVSNVVIVCTYDEGAEVECGQDETKTSESVGK